MSFDEVLIFLAAGPLPLLVFGFCCWRVTHIVARRTLQNCRASARQLTPLLIAMNGIVIVWALLGLAVYVETVMSDGKMMAEAAIVFGLFLSVCILFGLATIPIFKIRSALRGMVNEESRETQRRIDRFAGIVETIGWATVIVGAVVASVPISFWLFLFGALAFGLIPALFWQRRRTREGQFLWLLALSVKYRHDLAQEVEDHAATWRGSYAIRLRQLATYLRAGQPLGMALSQIPGLLPCWVIASIQIGDETGTLSEVLNECATAQLKWMKEQFRTGSIAGLLIYLGCYLWVTALPVSFLMYFIIPKYKAIFADFGIELPAVTLGFIRACETWLPIIVLLAPFSVVFAVALLRFDHSGWRNVRARLFRRWYPSYDASPILRHLSRMIRLGKTLPDSLLAIANSYHRRTVAEAIAQVSVEVEAGEDCWKGLLQRGFISRRDLALIEAAQRNGNLPWALQEIADLREKRYLFRVDTTCQLFRPVPVLAVSLVVGWICLAMFLPLVKLVNDLS